MQNSTSTVIALFVAAIFLFVVPLVTLTERNDNVVQENVKLIVEEFVTDIKNTGKLTNAKLQDFENRLAATGNTYDIEMEVKVLDENPGKKTTQASSTKIGENVYYSMYTSQILDTLSSSDGTTKVLALKEGDMFSTSVRNTNTTLSQQLKNFFYTVAGNDTYTIAAEHGGYVTANGSGN